MLPILRDINFTVDRRPRGICGDFRSLRFGKHHRDDYPRLKGRTGGKAGGAYRGWLSDRNGGIDATSIPHPS